MFKNEQTNAKREQEGCSAAQKIINYFTTFILSVVRFCNRTVSRKRMFIKKFVIYVV